MDTVRNEFINFERKLLGICALGRWRRKCRITLR
jgi:hypothetical protein